MIKFKKNQQIVYDVTFRHIERDVRVRFLITKSKTTEIRNIDDPIRNEVYKAKFTDDIYNLYRVETIGSYERRVLLLTSRIYNLCINAIKYVLELNNFDS